MNLLMDGCKLETRMPQCEGRCQREHSLALGLAICLLLILGCGQAPAPNIVLVSFDTLRADYLGAYGHEAGASPHIDALAQQGTVFLSARSVSSWTRPAHFSMLTGLYPDRKMATYGDGNGGCRIRDDIRTLAEHLSEAGYQTAAFTGGGYIHDDSGFEQGFESFATSGRRFENNLNALDRWLNEPHERPVFLFLHNFNAHRPYKAPRAFIDRFVSNPPAECAGVDFSLKHSWRQCVDAPGGPAYLEALYAAEVAYVDELFGDFVAKFRKHNSTRDTLFVLTADHGDELLERGKLDHIRTLYGELVNVPLIIQGPGVPTDHRVTSGVGLVDVMPTILDLAGLGVPEEVDGSSLTHYLAGSSAAREASDEAGQPSAPQFALSGWRPQDSWGQTHTFTASIIRGGRKLIQQGLDGDTKFERYDLEADPLETEALTQAGDAAPKDQSQLANWIEQQSSRTYCEDHQMSDAVKRQLEALGYVDP